MCLRKCLSIAIYHVMVNVEYVQFVVGKRDLQTVIIIASTRPIISTNFL